MNRQSAALRFGLSIWIYVVIAIFLVAHIPQKLWAILEKLGLLEVVQRLQEWLFAFFSAEYLS